MEDKQPLNNMYIHSWEGETPVLLEMPHSGHVGEGSARGVPDCIAKKIRYDSPKVRATIGAGCDAAVPDMSAFFSHSHRFKLSAIYNSLCRTYCDTNRSKSEVSDFAVQGGVPNNHHHGIIWDLTLQTGLDINLQDEWLEAEFKNCEKMLTEPLTWPEFDELMAQVYHVHHLKILYLHWAHIKKHGYCVHLALHSLPPLSVTKYKGAYIMGTRSARGPFDLKNNTLPDVILIHNDYQAAEKTLVDKVRSAFEEHGLIVEDGTGPFLGDIGVTKMYGYPKVGVNVIGIEHVSHTTEPDRHKGDSKINLYEAIKYQNAYDKAIQNLLK